MEPRQAWGVNLCKQYDIQQGHVQSLLLAWDNLQCQYRLWNTWIENGTAEKSLRILVDKNWTGSVHLWARNPRVS